MEIINTRTGKTELTAATAATNINGIIRAFCDLLCDPYTQREFSAGPNMPLTAKEKDGITERIARYVCEQEHNAWMQKETARKAERAADKAARARICTCCGKPFSIAALYPANDPRTRCYFCDPIHFPPYLQHETTWEEGEYWEGRCLDMVPLPD